LRAWYRSRRDHDNRIDLSIIGRSEGRWIGEVVLNELDVNNRSCGFRILVGAAEHRSHGYGTEAIRLVLDHAFGTVGLHRVQLEVYDFNPRARHVYEKVGFVYEGTKRHALCWEGQWIDAHLMAILSSDWPAPRA
jgi:RimJ/RimL family protein N-acetyltransferase